MRSIQKLSKPFALWGAATIGLISVSTSLTTIQIILPEWTGSLIFATAGLSFALAVTLNNYDFPQVNSKSEGVRSSRVLFALVIFSALYGLLNESFVFPIVMVLGYLPVLALSNRHVPKESYRSAVFSGLLVFGVAILVESTLLSSIFYGDCRFDKCSIWGSSIGNLSSGNALGLACSFLGLIGMSLAKSNFHKALLWLSILVLVDAASGRTALFTYLLASALFTSGLLLRRFARTGRFVVLISLLVSAIWAIYPFQAESFTLRGELWAYAKREISSSPFFGHGPSAWVRQNGSIQYFLNYSTHNLWLEAAYSIGFVGLAIFAYALVAQKALWVDSTSPQRALFFWIIFSGLTEVPSFPTRIYLVPAALVVYFMIGASDERNAQNGLG